MIQGRQGSAGRRSRQRQAWPPQPDPHPDGPNWSLMPAVLSLRQGKAPLLCEVGRAAEWERREPSSLRIAPGSEPDRLCQMSSRSMQTERPLPLRRGPAGEGSGERGSRGGSWRGQRRRDGIGALAQPASRDDRGKHRPLVSPSVGRVALQAVLALGMRGAKGRRPAGSVTIDAILPHPGRMRNGRWRAHIGPHPVTGRGSA